MSSPSSRPQREPRSYNSPRRTEQAARTRAAILDSARELFVTKGYAVTTVADVARHARVAVDTVYSTMGRKPELLLQVLESALSGTDDPVPGPLREYASEVRAATTARAKITAYVTGLVALHARLAPVFGAVRDAGSVDAEAAATWQRISQRRAHNMADFAAELRTTGELRDDLEDRLVGDIIWSMNGPEYWALLVGERGWTHTRFAAHLIDAWTRMFLRHPTPCDPSGGTS